MHKIIKIEKISCLLRVLHVLCVLKFSIPLSSNSSASKISFSFFFSILHSVGTLSYSNVKGYIGAT